MTDLVLLPGEEIIKRATGVYYKSSLFSAYEDELVLTNLHLIHVDRGLVKVKSVRKIPLEQIIGSRVICDKNEENDEYEMLVPLKSGERLAFQFSNGKRETRKWADEVRSAIIGGGFEDDPPQGSSIVEGIKGMAIGLIRDVLSIEDEPVVPDAHYSPVPPKKTYSPPKQPRKTTKKCIGCGAPLTGSVGQIVICEYCGLEQEL